MWNNLYGYLCKIFNSIYGYYQIEKFSAIKNFNYLNQDKETKLKNHIILLELIKNLEKLDTVDLVLNNGFYIDEKDINNIPEESEEYNKIKKYY